MIELTKLKQIEEDVDKLAKKTHIFSLLRFCICICAIISIVCLLCLDNFVLYLSLSLFFILALIGFAIGTNPIYL